MKSVLIRGYILLERFPSRGNNYTYLAEGFKTYIPSLAVI